MWEQVSRRNYCQISMDSMSSLKRALPITFALLFFYLYFLSKIAFLNGYASSELLLFGEKSLLVFHGKPPRLENLGFVYPPLPYLFVLIFRDPFIGTAFTSAISASLFIFFLHTAVRNCSVTSIIFALILLFMLCSPISLFFFTQRTSLVAFFTVLVVMFQYLYRYCRAHATSDLLLFGMFTSPLFFARFQSIIILPFIVLPLLLSSKEQGIGRRLTIAFIAFFPSVFFVVSWCYLNWIFMGDPLYFFHYWMTTVANPLRVAYNRNLLSVFDYCVKLCWQMSPFILPLLVAFLRYIKTGFLKCPVSPFVMLTPFLLIMLDTYVGVFYEHSTSYFILFPLIALLQWINVPLKESLFAKRLFDFLFCVSLTIAFIYSIHSILPFTRNNISEEALFCRALAKPIFGTVLDDAREVVRNIETDGLVLIDDTRSYPVVFLHGKPERLILPYQYEFETVLYSPELYADYIVISRSKIPGENITDRIGGRWKEALYGIFNNYQLVIQNNNFLLYRRKPLVK